MIDNQAIRRLLLRTAARDEGSAEAFERLYRRHADRVYGLCWRLCDGDKAKAEQTLAAMRAAWPSDKPMGVRISSTDWVEGGWNPDGSVALARELKKLRYPADSPVTPDPMVGSYLATYFIEASGSREWGEWAAKEVHHLHEAGRMFPHRDHIHTQMYVYRGGVFRDPDGVPAVLALDHPFQGLVATMVEARGERKAAARWLADELLPALLPGSPVAMSLAFTRLSPTPIVQTLHHSPSEAELKLWAHYPEARYIAMQLRDTLEVEVADQLRQCRCAHAFCFSLQVMQTRVHGMALRRASAIGSPQSRQIP